MRRVAEECVRMRFVVLGVWLAATIGLTVLAGAVGGEAEDDYALPGSESERASAILREGGFSFGGGTQAQLVLQRDGGLDHPAARAVVDELVAQVRQAAPDARVSGPFEDDTHHQVSEDGEIAFIAVDLPEQDPDDFAALAEELDDIRESFSGESLRVELGGLTLEQEAESGPPSELVGVLAAVVILLFAFGSVFAMALPILVGVMGAASGVAGVGLAARWVEMPTFAAPVAAMIAIGVGVDYALLVVTRYREGLSAGLPTADAIVVAQTTAGRSVIFAGVTVVIASLGLVLMDLKLITGVALGIAGSVLITMLAAVALLPALMAIVGHRIDKFSVRRRRAHHDGGPARRWSHQVQKHPLPWALGATTLLILLSIPTLDMRLGFSDAGTNSTRDTSRRAYDLLADGFGPGSNGPLVVAARGDADSAPAYEQLADALGQTEGVAQVSPPIVSADGSVALVQVVPETGPRDAETTDLVHHLRDEVVSAVAGKSLSEVAVGGATAAAVDFADYNTERLPIFLTVVLGLALLLLMAVFRGFPVAVKAVVVNLLSIGASFGVTVAVFQWGWGVDLLDLGAAGPFEAWAPMMLIAIVFGLSMDYEVFLLSRIREEYERTGDNADAVAQGLAQTARVITAAAAIMVCVFGSFVLGSSRELQLFGFGLASAVLIDATVVRLVLVPAVMELLGDRNWWLPPWLNRTLPHLRIEASEREPVDA